MKNPFKNISWRVQAVIAISAILFIPLMWVSYIAMPKHSAASTKVQIIKTPETPTQIFFRRGDWVPAETAIMQDEGEGCIIAVKVKDGPIILTYSLTCKAK